MKLYTFPVAPNPTKVAVYLAEKGIALERELVSLLEGAQRRPKHLARNALGKLPVLELDDGSFLTESLAIIEYLEELHPEPSMLGATPLERAQTRELERICDLGVLLPIARFIHATNSPLGLPQRPEVAEEAWESLLQNLAVLDVRIGEGPFVAGERPTIADCTLWAGFGFARFRGVEPPEGFPSVDAWRERFARRPSVKG
jgi:glutathione S-transferase